jgi:adenylate cyclase
VSPLRLADERSRAEPLEPPSVEEVGRRLWRAGLLANTVGAVVVFNLIGSLIPIFASADERTTIGVRNAPLVVLVFLVASPIVTRINRRSAREALSWLDEGREPSPAEQRLTLALPLRQARVAAASWLASVPLFVVANLVTSAGFAAVAGTVICDGGVVTAALIYLRFEQILRPVTAAALAARPPAGTVAPGITRRLASMWALATGIPVAGILVVGTVGITKSGVDASYVSVACILLGAIALVVGWIATAATARAIAGPLSAVREALGRVEAGDLGARVRVDDGSEIGLLQAGFNRMAEGLRERDRIRDLFGRHVGRDVASAALEREGTLGGEEREIGALFIDLAGSTALAHERPPTEVVELLNRFFRLVVEEIEAEGGLINKFEGDAALCVFGAPGELEDPAGSALRAARRLSARVKDELPEVRFGIGVSAGTAVAGNVGAEHRFEYTVIGDPVNEAARLCELAKERSERVLASAAALGLATNGEAGGWRLDGRRVLRGRTVETGLAVPASGGAE